VFPRYFLQPLAEARSRQLHIAEASSCPAAKPGTRRQRQSGDMGQRTMFASFMTRKKAGRQDCKGTHSNRRSSPSKGYRDRLVAQTCPFPQRRAEAKQVAILSQHRSIVMPQRPEGFISWPLAHLPRPVAFAPRQSSTLSRELSVGRAAYSSGHAFAQKVEPNTGLHRAHSGRTG
jgi:hypothetical protein